jgi:histidine triad (HIT) family protein
MTPAYDDNNIFAKILRGEAPSVKLYEDDAALAFMDVMPRAPGHLLVIPKNPARNLLDIPAPVLAGLIPIVQTLARAAKAGLAADGVSVFQFNESAGGQVVFHLHFHVIPRMAGDELKPPGGPLASAAELEPIAARIRAALNKA